MARCDWRTETNRNPTLSRLWITRPVVRPFERFSLPEYSIFGSGTDGGAETLVSGIADAVARDASDKIKAIIDWKSDVEMNTDKLAA